MPIPAVASGKLSWPCVSLLLLSAAAAQSTDDMATAAERWLASEQNDVELRDRASQLLLREPKLGAAWLAAQLPAMSRAPTESRSKGVQALAMQFVLGHLEQQRKTGMTYSGQYDLLLQLQPFSGDFLFELLLQPPDWFPLTHRVRLVAPLRDLQPRTPDTARLEAVVALVENKTVEPQELRWALAAALWQWGTRKYAEEVVAELRQNAGEGDAEDRVQSTLALADYHTLLRDYRKSAAAHVSAQLLARSGNVQLRPVAWYAAGCVHALLGESERALVALETCATMLASPDLDSSLRLSRSLFDTDPELASLRGDPRFAALVTKAFGAGATGGR
jgi:hypothetical protein